MRAQHISWGRVFHTCAVRSVCLSIRPSVTLRFIRYPHFWPPAYTVAPSRPSRDHDFTESRPWDHKIELKEGFQPKSFKSYNLTPEEQTELDKFLKENLEKGYIRPSQSPMATPFFFVKKKDGKLRPCQDYRYLNEERLPITPHFWTHRQDQRCQIFYKTGRPMGVQQYPNLRRWSIERGLQNK